MTAGEVIAAADALRPNPYPAAQKLDWLRTLDGKLQVEFIDNPVFWQLPPSYNEESELLAPFPYDWELYTSWLFAQIDLHNGEIVKYNQSMALFASAWRQLADFLIRSRTLDAARSWRL